LSTRNFELIGRDYYVLKSAIVFIASFNIPKEIKMNLNPIDIGKNVVETGVGIAKDTIGGAVEGAVEGAVTGLLTGGPAGAAAGAAAGATTGATEAATESTLEALDKNILSF